MVKLQPNLAIKCGPQNPHKNPSSLTEHSIGVFGALGPDMIRPAQTGGRQHL